MAKGKNYWDDEEGDLVPGGVETGNEPPPFEPPADEPPADEPPPLPSPSVDGGGGAIDIGPGNVPEAGEGPGAIESSGTGSDDATPWEVTEEQTVAGQMEKNYDRGSPFMEKAAQEASRRHLAGGGQNSLMAGKAGVSAAMDVAFKMSFADATTYARSAEFTAAMKNQFGLAEQRFIQNSLLSDQNFDQAIVMQTQMIAGQLEGIRMEFKGRGMLVDKEFDQFFAKVSYQAKLREYGEQTGFQRAISLQAMISQGGYLTRGFESVMQYANREGFTPEQSAAAVRSGMGFLREAFDINEAFWASVGAGGDPSDVSMPEAPFGGSYPWWDYSGV